MCVCTARCVVVLCHVFFVPRPFFLVQESHIQKKKVPTFITNISQSQRVAAENGKKLDLISKECE